jgi:hypothetical protein
MLRELAPLLAEDGIDLDDPGTLDPVVLQLALNRAVERRNLALFHPGGGGARHDRHDAAAGGRGDR